MTIETLIGNYAFPVAVTLWLLYERQKELKELIKAVQALTDVVERLCNKLNQDVTQ